MKLAKYKRLKAEQEIKEIKNELYDKGYLIAIRYLPLKLDSDILLEGKVYKPAKLEWYYSPIKLKDALVNDPLLAYQYA